MNIRTSLREKLLIYETVELDENIYTQLGGKINDFLDKNYKKIKAKISQNKNVVAVKTIKQNLQIAFDNLKAGKVLEEVNGKKNPNYNAEMNKHFRKSVYDFLKLIGVASFFLVPFGGISAVTLIKILKFIGPRKIKDFLSFSFQEGENDFIMEFFSITEDMGYFGVTDATQDEYQVGLKESLYFNDGKFNKNGTNTLYNDGEVVVNFGVGAVGSFELNGQHFDNGLYLKGGYHSPKKGGGHLGIKTIFEKLPKIENIVLECFDNVLGFWTHIGGKVVDVRQNKNGDNVNTVVINRASYQ
jgi:hypothetical protein